MTRRYPAARVRWSNGHVDSAATWDELEEKLRLSQWHVYEPDDFRLVMQKRALRWSGVEIAIHGSSQEFFQELARASLVLVLGRTDPDWEEDEL